MILEVAARVTRLHCKRFLAPCSVARTLDLNAKQLDIAVTFEHAAWSATSFVLHSYMPPSVACDCIRRVSSMQQASVGITLTSSLCDKRNSTPRWPRVFFKYQHLALCAAAGTLTQQICGQWVSP
jgi:hypothetical protein